MDPEEAAANEFKGKGAEADEIPVGDEEYGEPTWPAGQVGVRPLPGSESGPWFVEERLFPRFKREDVPTREQRRTEHRRLGPTRRATDGKGHCWTECQVQDETYKRKYFLVQQYYEHWRINTTLKSYYGWITGEASTHVSTTLSAATLSAGGKTVAQALGASAGLSSGLTVAGVGITAFVTTTYLVQHWVKDSVRVTAGWKMVPERSGYTRWALEKQSTPYWGRCGDVEPCGDTPAETTSPTITETVPADDPLPKDPPAPPPGIAAPPTLVPGEIPDEYVPEGWPSGQAAVTPLPGSEAGPWFVEERLFPRFKREEVPTRAVEVTEFKPFPRATREASDGKGACWTECQGVDETHRTPYFLVSQYVEYWRINRSLKAYYEFITGEWTSYPGAGITGATASNAGEATVLEKAAKGTLKGAIGKTLPGFGQATAQKIAGKAAAGMNAAALGITLFVEVTYLVKHFVEDSVLIDAVWREVPAMSGPGDRRLVRVSSAYWKRCGEIRECPPAKAAPKTRPILPFPWPIALGALILLLLAAILVVPRLGGEARPSPAASAPAGEAGAPRVTRFLATLAPPVTTYTVEVAGTGPFTYQWTANASCPGFEPSTAATARWSHPHPPCPEQPLHPGQITVVVRDAAGRETRYTYSGGSAPADIRP